MTRLKTILSFPFEGLHYKNGKLNWLFIIGSILLTLGLTSLTYGFWLMFAEHMPYSFITAKLLLAGIISACIGYFFRVSSKNYKDPEHKKYFGLDSKNY